MPNIENILAQFAKDLLPLDWFSHSNEIPEDAKSDMITGIGEAVHAFTQESNLEASKKASERFIKEILSTTSVTSEDVSNALSAFDSQLEEDFRKKIRRSFPMSVHTKRLADKFVYCLRYGFLANLFPDVKSGASFRVWCNWLRRGHFACYWDGELTDPEFDDVFVLMYEQRG